jgi:putative ABC transport system ATP-binding protein
MNDDELAKARREKIGFVFQFFYLIPSLTTMGNVMLPMSFAGLDGKEQSKRAKELLEMVGLGHRLEHRPNELSGGERQRVAIARAMANKPPIILADEPTGNLDSKSGSEVMKILMHLNKEYKTTIIIVTHDKNIVSCAMRTIHLKDGEIVSEEKKPKKEE